jgi:hypothetical protein
MILWADLSNLSYFNSVGGIPLLLMCNFEQWLTDLNHFCVSKTEGKTRDRIFQQHRYSVWRHLIKVMKCVGTKQECHIRCLK